VWPPSSHHVRNAHHQLKRMLAFSDIFHKRLGKNVRKFQGGGIFLTRTVYMKYCMQYYGCRVCVYYFVIMRNIRYVIGCCVTNKALNQFPVQIQIDCIQCPVAAGNWPLVCTIPSKFATGRMILQPAYSKNKSHTAKAANEMLSIIYSELTLCQMHTDYWRNCLWPCCNHVWP